MRGFCSADFCPLFFAVNVAAFVILAASTFPAALLLQHHRFSRSNLQLCALKTRWQAVHTLLGTYHAAISKTIDKAMASNVDKQQTLDWAAARQAWDQHVEALDTDAGERADGVTALESKLGTRAHWDGVYERELRNFAHDPSDEGVDWFSDDVGDRLMEYVTENCPLEDGVLDLGCGSAVFLLDLAAKREGRFLGIDYSEVAVALAANVGRKRGLSQVRFCHADATRLEDLGERFGLVLDKGTFDAYMLGAAASVDRYAASVRAALKPGGVFVVTTCNSTADEVAALFTARGFVERDRVPYPTFEFGGRKGAAVATVALVSAGDG